MQSAILRLGQTGFVGFRGAQVLPTLRHTRLFGMGSHVSDNDPEVKMQIYDVTARCGQILCEEQEAWVCCWAFEQVQAGTLFEFVTLTSLSYFTGIGKGKGALLVR